MRTSPPVAGRTTTGRRAPSGGRLVALALAILVVCSLFPVGGAIDTASGQTPTGPGTRPTPTPAPISTASFNDTNVSQERGDVARIGLSLTGTVTANVTVGSEAKNYLVNTTIEDVDGDGEVVLALNTYVAGRDPEARSYHALGVDNVSSVRRTTGRLPGPLETSTYNLSVAVDGEATDTGTLDLSARSTDGLVGWREPASVFDAVSTKREVVDAIDRGTITTTDELAAGDVLVGQVQASGIYGALAVENLSALLRDGSLSVSMRQTNPETNRRPKRLDVASSLENGSIRAIPDTRNDTLYLNVDTEAAVVDGGTIDPGEEYRLRFGVNERSGLVGENQTVVENVSVVAPELELGDLALSRARNRTVSGNTSLAPGSRIRLDASVENGTFSRNQTVPVASNGSFETTFDLSTLDGGTELTVSANGPLNTSDEIETVVGRSERRRASLAIDVERTNETRLVLSNVTLPEGGFVDVYQGNTSRNPIGVSSYLDNGTNENVTIGFEEALSNTTNVSAIAHRDNGNERYEFGENTSLDRPYTTNGTNVSESARIVVRTETTRGIETSTTSTTTATTSTVEGPGFGVFVALIALAAAFVLTRRR